MGDAVNMNCLLIPGMEVHVVFGGLAIVVTLVTVDPMALRPRLSPGLPLSNSRAKTDYLLEENSEPGCGPGSPLQYQLLIDDLWRPGNHGHECDGRPVGFASPVFTGFAFFVCFLLPYCILISPDYSIQFRRLSQLKLQGTSRTFQPVKIW